MPELAFVMSPSQNGFFDEFVETLRHELRDQGVPSSVHTEGFPEPTPERVYALVSPHEFVALKGQDALADEAILKRTIFICSEQPGSAGFDRDLELSRDAGVVFTINARAVAEFWRGGVPARHLRPGYSALRDRFDPGVQRDIDVVFFGALTRRRTKYLAACAEVLAPYNCGLEFSDSPETNSGGSPMFVADAKWDLLSRAKIVLNIHRGDQRDFEWLRALDAIHAGAVVVTEHSGGISPLVAGEHLFAASPASLPVILDVALRDSERLARMRAAARERIRSWVPMALSVAVLRAAAVELVGRPLPSGTPLGRSLGSHRRPPERRSQTESGEADAGSAAIRDGLKDLSLDLIEVRREVSRLEQLVRSGGDAPCGPRVVHESPAWDLRRHPRVTVVTALHNRSTVIGQALDSVSRGHMREFELIVIDDGSSDGSRETTAEWMIAHPWIAARLIGHGASRGLGAARNTAVDAARAPYCFVLDAENEIYPRCLHALAAALDSLPEIAFAYPMLEVFGITEAFGEEDAGDLRSVLDWQPERLRLGNYIEALSMIRVSRLRELRGFTTDHRLNGCEEYDLWCRMAERGWAGKLVPQILARYRASPSWMAPSASSGALTSPTRPA